MFALTREHYTGLIKSAFYEDLSDNGDVTSKAIFSGNTSGKFKLYAKDNGIVCGIDVFTEALHFIDENTSVLTNYQDGDTIKKGDVVAEVQGNVSSILQGERVALNFISHLSAIATKTYTYVNRAEGKIKILDTRKTIPGLRILQKYAVACGGGTNHRMGLYDMVMIKDNHIDAAGSITNAVKLVRKKWGETFKIEVETRNLDEVREALAMRCNRIMLDNMNIDTIKEAVQIVNKECEIEVSGNMTLESIDTLKETGIDYISFGGLTHTVNVFDFSLKLDSYD